MKFSGRKRAPRLWLIRCALALVFSLAGLLALGVAGASAHASFVSSDPAPGTTLVGPPATIQITFSEVPDIRLSSVRILDAAGSTVSASDAEAAPVEPKTLTVRPRSRLEQGVYTVSWRVVSRADGHVTAGTFAFGIGVAPSAEQTTSTPEQPPINPLGVVGKWLLYLGCATVIGAAWVKMLARRSDRAIDDQHAKGMASLLLYGATAAAVGSVTMMIAVASNAGAGLTAFVTSSTGRPYLALLVISFAIVASALYLRFQAASTAWTLAAIGAAAALLVRADSGHAAAAGAVPLQVSTQWAHMLAASVWVGGFLPLLFVVRGQTPMSGAPDATEPARASTDALVRRFSTSATAAVVIVVVAGVFRSISEIGLGRLLEAPTTGYGRVLIAKVILAAGLIALGGFNRRRNLSGDRKSSLYKALRAEVALGVLVFGLTGVLTSLAPRPVTSGSSIARAAIVVRGYDSATTMRAKLSVDPGAPGLNRFRLKVTDFDTGQVINANEVSLAFHYLGGGVPDSTLRLLRSGQSWIADSANLSLQGPWRITATVEQDRVGTVIPLELSTAPPEQSVSISSQQGLPDIYTVTLADGYSMQTYADPGSEGAQEIHVTFIGPGGAEVSIRSVSVVADPVTGANVSAIRVPMERFSRGHFIGPSTLVQGSWTLYVSATTRSGRPLLAAPVLTITAPSGG